MTPRDIVLEQIHHRETRPIPATLTFEPGVDERLDDHYGGPGWRERIPRYIVRVTTVDEDRKVEIDETHYRDGFGSVWSTAGRPFHLERPGLKAADFDDYAFPSAGTFLDSQREKQAAEICGAHPGSFRIAGFGWGLFERSWNIRGFQEALTDVIAEPDFYEEMLDRITDLHLKFVEASVQLPVDGIMFSDDWGDQRGVLIGPERWRRFLKPRLAKLYKAAHDAGKLTLSHCCGNVADIMPDIIEIGLDVLESVQPEAMSPYDLKRKWGDKMTFWGGLGSQSTIPFGTRQAIFDEVQHLCEEMSPGGGYILAPAKSIQPETPIANAAAVLEAFVKCTGHAGAAAGGS
jgi:uroporphyrinogen decarboxylase